MRPLHLHRRRFARSRPHAAPARGFPQARCSYRVYRSLAYRARHREVAHCGHDAGCAIGVEYAHRYPYRVGRLALLTPSIFPDLKPFYLFEILRTPVVGEAMAPLSICSSASSLCGWLSKRALIPTMTATTSCMTSKLHSTDSLVPGVSCPCSAGEILSTYSPPCPGTSPSYAPPLSIFHGKRDAAVPPAFATRAASLIPESEVMLLNSRHFLPLSESATIARELLRFLGAKCCPQSQFPAAVD
jgi:pimeloyl-ACP methyl ester carboxylesterase